MNGDTAIMQEIEAFLGDYGFSRTSFIDFMIKMEEDEKENAHDDKPYLDRGNCNKYFNGRSVPLYNLLKISDYLCCFEWELEQNDSRLDQYRERAKKIKEDIIDYIVKNRNTSKSVPAEIREVLDRMEDEEIDALFRSLYVFSMSERLWTFWACYSCLHYAAQEAIMEKLSGFIVPPIVYTDSLYRFHVWETEVNVPLRAEFEKRYKKYQEQSKVGEADARKQFIEALVKMLKAYPFAFQDTVRYFEERATQRPDRGDMPVLTAYSLMCSTLDSAEQTEIDRAIMEYLRDSGNWRILTKIDWNNVNWEALPKIEKVPEEIVHYFAGRFAACNAE